MGEEAPTPYLTNYTIASEWAKLEYYSSHRYYPTITAINLSNGVSKNGIAILGFCHRHKHQEYLAFFTIWNPLSQCLIDESIEEIAIILTILNRGSGIMR